QNQNNQSTSRHTPASCCTERLRTDMHWLDHRLPPPLVFVFVGVAMWWVGSLPGEIVMGATARITVAAIIACAGFALGLAAGVAFLRAKTTVDPHKPQAASSL